MPRWSQTSAARARHAPPAPSGGQPQANEPSSPLASSISASASACAIFLGAPPGIAAAEQPTTATEVPDVFGAARTEPKTPVLGARGKSGATR